MEQQLIPVRQVREAGAGTYTEITVIEAPASASAGSLVQIKVTIKNNYSSEISIKVAGALSYGVSPMPAISFPNDWANFPAGASYYFSGSFFMPAYSVVIYAYSYYYASNDVWYPDDERTKSVSLDELQAEFQSLIVSYAKV